MRNSLFIGIAAAALIAPMAAHAQETSSQIRGSVTSEGQPVAGAEITVTHEPSGTVSTATADANGDYSASGLRVGGPFTVAVTAPGFEDSSVTDIFLTAGQPFRVPLELLSAQEIVVTASASSATELSTGPITALDREDIEGVASITRDIRDIARRDPFVTIDPSNSRTIEIAGQNGRLNRFSVDGVQFSDDFGLNNGGLPTSRGPVPFDAIEQLSVKVAPYDIAEGDFQGGALNVILRSGENDFSGSAFYTYSDQDLTGDQTRRSRLRVSPTNPDGRVILEFDSKQYGGLISGPIIRDRVFFMAAYEKLEEQDPFDDGLGDGFANQVPNLTIGTVDNVSAIAQSVYGYDTLGLIQNAVEEDEKIVAKLDVNITDDQRASLTYIRNVGTQQFQQNTNTGGNAGQSSIGLQSNGYELGEEVNSGVFQLNSQWSDQFSTEFRASYRDYNRDQTPFGGREIAQFEVCTDPTTVLTNGVNAAPTACGAGRVFFGPDVSRQANDLNTSNTSIDLLARLDLGAHRLKFIAGFTDIDVFNLFLQNSLGNIYFDSIADFTARRANRLIYQDAVPSLDANDAAARFGTQVYTIGLQDDWEISDDFQITIGARYDLYNNDTRPPLNANFVARNGFSNRETYSGLGVLQPRVGFNWTPADRIQIRGGVGIFAGGSPDVFLSNSFSNTGQLTNSVTITRQGTVTSTGIPCSVAVGTPNRDAICAGALEGVTGRSPFPAAVEQFLATNTGSLAAAPVNAVDPEFNIPRQLRATLSATYEADLGFLGDGWLFGADFLYGNTIEGVQYFDNRSVVIGTLPDGRPRYGQRPGTGAPTSNQDLILSNDDRGRSFIGVARISKEFDFGLSLDLSYTRQDIQDTNAVTSAVANSNYNNNAFVDPNFSALGTSIYQIKDQYKFNIDFKREFIENAETRLTIFGEYRSGRPYSITGFSPNDGSGRTIIGGTVATGARGLLYIPTINDPLVSFDSVATQTRFNELVANLGLEGFRGSIIDKNSQQSPDFFKIDLRVSQDIPLSFLKDTARIRLFADIENVLNLIDSDLGSLRQAPFPYTTTIATVQCLSAATPTGTGVVAIGTAPAANPAGLPAVLNTSSTQPCAQYRYSAALTPTQESILEGLVTRQSLYQIRVGVKFEF